jgi:hypothetical protein
MSLHCKSRFHEFTEDGLKLDFTAFQVRAIDGKFFEEAFMEEEEVFVRSCLTGSEYGINREK